MHLERKILHHGTSTVNGSFVLLVVGSKHSLKISHMRMAGKINFDEGIREKTHPEVGKEAGGVGALPYSYIEMKEMLIGNFEKPRKRYQDPVLRA